MSDPSRIDPDRAGQIFRAVRDSNLLQTDNKSFLVHDLSWMKFRLDTIRNAFPKAQHTLAIKANPLVNVLRVAVDRDFGLEAASIEEVALAIAAGCPPDRIVFDSPAKTAAEIVEALRLGILLNVDNFSELVRVEAAIHDTGIRAPIGIRINPEVSVGQIGQTSVGSIGSKFGVSISSDREAIVAAYRRHPWLNAIHTHVGSQGCGLELLVEAVAKVEQLRRELESEVGRPIPIFNMGGGLPVAYLEADEPPTPGQYAAALQQLAPTLFDSDVTLFSEFGRAIQANCGLAFSRVETVRKIGGGKLLVAIHFGADFLLRPIYRSHEWAHEFLCFDGAGRRLSQDIEATTLAGPLCFAGDLLGRDLPLPRVREGDWIAIRDTGAYTLSMWSRHCNRAIPAVIGYDEPDTFMLRDAESPDDIVRMWS